MAFRVRMVGAVFGFPAPAENSQPTREPAGWPGADRLARPVELSPLARHELDATLRFARWEAYGISDRRIRRRVTPVWHDEAVAALEYAIGSALADGAPVVGNRQLLDALLADSRGRAAFLIHQHGLNVEMIDEVVRAQWPPSDARPAVPTVDFLRFLGLLEQPDETSDGPTGASWLARSYSVVTGIGSILVGIELAAIRQAIRFGHRQVRVIHLVLGLLSYEEQLRLSGLRPVDRRAGAPILEPRGAMLSAAVPLISSTYPDEPIAPARRRRPWRHNRHNPTWSVAAARVAERARELAAQDGAPAGTTHLLRALLTDADESARHLLVQLGVDPVVA